MKYYSILLAILLTTSTSLSISQADNSDPAVVAQVDLNKYSGKWYEIARYPTFFQKDCVSSTAEYQVLSDNSLSVHNICYKEDRSTSDIKGTAKIVNANVPAKLKVRFNIFAQGDYWIIALDPNYQWAVVSSAKKGSLFVLARTAPMESGLKSKIILDLKNRGFDAEKIVYDKY
jgi:apolipoprotein D and lipocalin family protein